MFAIKSIHPIGSCAAALFLALLLVNCAGAPPPAGTSSPRRQGAAAATDQPLWAQDLAAAYPESRFVAAIGYGASRAAAEQSALGNLVAVFGQSVQTDMQAAYRYSQAMENGILQSFEQQELQNAVRTSATHDFIYGAEIKDAWHNLQERTFYAVAAIERLPATLVYSELVDGNQRIIDELLVFPPEDRNSFEVISRYGRAAIIADANDAFVNILTILTPASGALHRETIGQGNKFRLEIQDIVRNIPVAVTVEGDRNGRIAAAFAQVFTQAGFRTRSSGDASERYALEVVYSITELERPGANKWVRYILDAQIRDRTSNQVLFPYNINDREGHLTLPEAENRAVRETEERIRNSFAEAFNQYLLSLTSQGSLSGM